MRYMIQYSGGLESTTFIYELLQKNVSGIFEILYVQSKKENNYYWAVQLLAVVDTIKKLQKEFPKAIFNLNLASITQRFPGHEIRDSVLYSLFTGIIIGKNVASYDGVYNGTSVSTETFQEITWNDAKYILNLYSESDRIKLKTPMMHVLREDVFKRLPASLKPLIWSCPNPVIKGNFAYACENCSKCSYNRRSGLTHPVKDITRLLPLIEAWDKYEKIQLGLLKELGIGLIGELA